MTKLVDVLGSNPSAVRHGSSNLPGCMWSVLSGMVPEPGCNPGARYALAVRSRHAPIGEVAERFIAAVSKTVVREERTGGSNPSFSVL